MVTTKSVLLLLLLSGRAMALDVASGMSLEAAGWLGSWMADWPADGWWLAALGLVALMALPSLLEVEEEAEAEFFY